MFKTNRINKNDVSWDPTSSFVPWEFQVLLLNGSMATTEKESSCAMIHISASLTILITKHSYEFSWIIFQWVAFNMLQLFKYYNCCCHKPESTMSMSNVYLISKINQKSLSTIPNNLNNYICKPKTKVYYAQHPR